MPAPEENLVVHLGRILKQIEECPTIPVVEYLHDVLKDGSIFQPKDEFDGVASGDSHQLVEAATCYAGRALIDDHGHPDFAAHKELERIGVASGWKVVAGETDGFGWLTGVIQTKKGRIVYG